MGAIDKHFFGRHRVFLLLEVAETVGFRFHRLKAFGVCLLGSRVGAALGEPSRTVGMIWRKSSPLSEQFGEVAEIVREAAVGLTEGKNLRWV